MQPKLQAAKKRAFLTTLADLGAVATACRALGLPRSAVYEWRDADPEFAEGWERAMDCAAAVLEAEALRRSVTGVEKPIYQGGVLVGTERVYSDRLLEVLLRAANRAKYGTTFVDSKTTGAVMLKVITGVPDRDEDGQSNARTHDVIDLEHDDEGGPRCRIDRVRLANPTEGLA